MIDINLYKDVFDKYTFDIHEAIESNKLGLLKHLINDINETFPYRDIRYTTNLDYTIHCYVESGQVQKMIRMVIYKGKTSVSDLSTHHTREILKLLELEKKYY